MPHPILMPKPGQMTEECTLTVWHKAEGDPVRRGDVLFEIETDKSIMDVEAFDDGVLLRRLAAEGETVPVNAVVAYVGEAGEAVPETPAPSAAKARGTSAPAVPPSAAVVDAPATSGAAAPPARPATATASAPGRIAISPRASRLAAEAGLDPRTLAGSGPDGRIVERDVRRAIERGDGAGAGAAPTAPTATAASATVPAAALALPPVEGEEAPVPLSRMRRTIAQRLTLSSTTIPHFTVTVAVDVTALQAIRAELRAAGTSLTVTDFVLAAAARSLVDLPDVNSRTDGTQVWRRHRVHLGLAVALPTGLVVPVIRDADRLTVLEIHDRATALADAARAGRLPIDDMTGSTFTVSNLGMFGVEAFSAIINPGESAILAVASAVPTPVVIGEGLAIRSVMRLTLSADHRIVDGELAARFLNAVRRRLEDPGSLRREIETA